MALDSRSMPVIVGLLVVLVIGVIVMTRNVLGPPDPASGPPQSSQLVEPRELHPQLEAGRASIRAGEFAEAKMQLGQVPESDTGYLLALNDLGILHARLGEFGDALTAFTTVLEHQPEDTFALYGTCASQIGLGQLDDAELTCLRVLEIEPGNARARFALGLIRVGQGRLSLGVDAYLRAAKQHEDQDSIRTAAMELYSFSQAHPEMAEPHYAVAVLSRLLANHETEREELEAYLELAPDGIAADNAREKLDELTKMGF